MSDPWWADKVGYQIYPRSFQDSNGDGIGDLPGILARLDHLSDLGVGFIWLSPVYRSPMADNGYDISDYRDIAPEFGTLDDMDRLIAEGRDRGMRIVMDLVVNHTSDRHAWFEAARGNRAAPTRDFYVWRDPGPDGGPPSDLRSMFGGPAWHWDEGSGQYYLALFTPQQPDLDWTNPAMRAELWDMMNWWKARGIGGFRMDVIDLIGKDVDAGIVADGPTLHDHLQEMHREVLAGSDLLTVGEAWSATTANALSYVGRDRGELQTLFQFAHITAHWHETHGKWKPREFSLPVLKGVLNDWQQALSEDGWNALFWSNHDLPRAVSSFGDEGTWRVRSAKLLGLVLHLMKGTPYIYQGEEIGMTNAGFTTIGQYRDVETLNFYAEQMDQGMSEADFLAGAARNSRDNARTPMQWTAGPNAGFTTGTPWLPPARNFAEINAQADRSQPDGVFDFYRHLVALRREHPVIVHGRYEPCLADHDEVLSYTRTLEGSRLSVIGNVSSREVTLEVPPELAIRGRCLAMTAGEREALDGTVTLAPWEGVAILA
ncbi:alpha-glucosidase [Wenxinia marina]|uniref:Glycosidase n=1 Tax=Wenxinia marina DSM 24838 TaxID=1123501 RepID=A0A0D0QBU7_9RHOB|nr:alpha-glucosidase [Wenxinia marina]KIQ69747.1 Glycosidase [Wenxinia marina DSM 24838]GGL60839.1 glucan 1,6-alpha-glucosidase [Wenxinia marina]